MRSRENSKLSSFCRNNPGHFLGNPSASTSCLPPPFPPSPLPDLALAAAAAAAAAASSSGSGGGLKAAAAARSWPPCPGGCGVDGATAPRWLRQGRLAASGWPCPAAPAPCLYTALGRGGRRAAVGDAVVMPCPHQWPQLRGRLPRAATARGHLRPGLLPGLDGSPWRCGVGVVAPQVSRRSGLAPHCRARPLLRRAGSPPRCRLLPLRRVGAPGHRPASLAWATIAAKGPPLPRAAARGLAPQEPDLDMDNATTSAIDELDAPRICGILNGEYWLLSKRNKISDQPPPPSTVATSLSETLSLYTSAAASASLVVDLLLVIANPSSRPPLLASGPQLVDLVLLIPNPSRRPPLLAAIRIPLHQGFGGDKGGWSRRLFPKEIQGGTTCSPISSSSGRVCNLLPPFGSMVRTDRSWMRLRRSSDEWQKQLNVFLDSKFQGTYQGETASCPCPDCNNVTYGTRFVVQKHLLTRGFHESFIQGVDFDDDEEEDSEGVGATTDGAAVNDLLTSLIKGAIRGDIVSTDEEPNERAKKFFNLLKEAEKELYPGCKEATKISFIVRLFQLKCIYGLSNSGLGAVLDLF
ncbi:hypothetical protein U9M48_003458 [Paspalum notatum var. saurae]|uniref:Transposase-associated domain-containing protein n=1 Tax=Paspalum notatum var. saurae TaxID=547442 RepID=A0AAQ3SI80_PASNO